MCFICSGLEKGRLTPNEAKANLVEMSMTIDVDHFDEVVDKINEVIAKNCVESCDFCDCSPCDCDWADE